MIALLALTALTALTSAFLLLWVEPLFARLALPLLGGSPAVWNTCLMYFQAALLGGYGLPVRELGIGRRKQSSGQQGGLAVGRSFWGTGRRAGLLARPFFQ